MCCGDLAAVEQAIAKGRDDLRCWQRRQHAERCLAAEGRPAAVRCGDRQGVRPIGERRQCLSRNDHCPAAAGRDLRGVADVIKQQRDRAALCHIHRRTGDDQGLTQLLRIQVVVFADGIHRQARGVAVDVKGEIAGGGVARHIADRHGKTGAAIINRGQRTGWHDQAPCPARLYGGAVDCTVNGDGNQLTRFDVGGGAGETLIGEALRAIDHVVTGKGIQRQGWQCAWLHFQRQVAAGGGGISGRIAGGYGQRIAAVAQPGINRGGQFQRPDAVDVSGGAQGSAVKAGHNQGVSFAAAGQRQRLLTFSGVNDAIGWRNEVQHRRQCIHHQVAISLAAVARHITDDHGVATIALRQRRQDIGRNGDLPVACGIDRAAVVVAAQRHDDGLAVAGHARVTGDRATGGGFLTVQNAIIKGHARCRHRQCAGNHRQGSVAGRQRLSVSVAGGGGDGLRAVCRSGKGACR